MTNFATYIDTTNDKAPIAQRGKAKQKRTDLRLVGLGMVVTRAGGIPLAWHAYPGNRPDVTQFPTLIDLLAARHLTHAHRRPGGGRSACGGGSGGGGDSASMTVVFDAGQNSAANFAHLTASGLHYVGSVPPSDCPDLLALPASGRTDAVPGYPGLSAIDTQRVVYGANRRVVLIHSQYLHDDQARSFTGTTLAKAGQPLDELAATLARGKTRRTRDQVTAEIAAITHEPWLRRVIDCDLTGDTPAAAPADLERQHRETGSVGRRGVRQTDPDHRPRDLDRHRRRRRLPIPIRNRVRLPATQGPPPGRPSHRCSTGPTTTSPCTPSPACSPCNWPTCMRLNAQRAGHDLSVRSLLDTLAGIEETVLIYPSTGGRPKARRITTDMTTDQQALYDLFQLNRWAAPSTT